MKKIFMLFISLLVLTACSHSIVSSAKKQDQNNLSNNGKVDGYIYHDSKTVLFLKFTNKDGNLSGSYYDRWEDTNNQFKTYDVPLTGQIVGNNISITMGVTGNTYTGNFSNGEIDLAVPQKNGTVSNFPFKPGTLTDFNKYVLDIQSSVSNDQQAAQQAQQNADLNKQLSDLEDKVNNEMQSIEADEQTLKNDVQDTGKEIDSEKKDMDSVKQDYKVVMNESSGSGATSDANAVGSDANAIQSDDNEIQSSYDPGFKHDVEILQNDLTSFQTDVENMKNLASQLGQTLPEYLPKKSDVKEIVSKGQSIIKSTTYSMNGYISTSKQMLDLANSLAGKAEKHAGN